MLHFADLVNRRDFIDNVVRGADPTQFAMAVCTMGRPSNIEDPRYADAGIPCWEIRARTRWSYPAAVIHLAALLYRQRVDIIHAHHYEPCLIAAVATVLRPGTKLVVGRHYSDAIYLHTTGWRRMAMLGLERLVNTKSSLIIAPSTRIAMLLIGRQGVPARKVTMIPYAFDPGRYGGVSADAVRAERHRLALDDKFSLGTFGRLYPDKGHRYVLDALPRVLRAVPRLRYLIVGEGAERPRLERQVRELGLDKIVVFLGWRRDVPELMAAVDIVVQPSLQEAFSQSMAEALFMGRPLVISDVSGADELVPDGSVGVVVPCHDSEALGLAIIELAKDGQRRGTLAAAGRRHAEKNFTMSEILPRFEEAYRGCIAIKPVRNKRPRII